MIDVPILVHVEELCADEQGNVVDADADQDFISLPVHGFVVVTVDLEEVKSNRRLATPAGSWERSCAQLEKHLE